MTFDEAAEIITTTVKNGWHMRTPIKTENMKPFEDEQPNGYVDLLIRESVSQQIEIGPTAKSFRPGSVIGSINVPENTGDAYARKLATALAAILEKKLIQGIQFRSATIAVIGIVESGYWRLAVSVPYYWRG